MSAGELVHTVATYAAVGSSALVGPVVIALSLSRGRPERADPVIRGWCTAVVGATGAREDVGGLENLPAGTCVLVCNHQSNFDAPFIFLRLPKHIRFVAKQELYRIPIFGAALKAMGNIRVERTGSDADRKRIEAAIEQVRTTTSILFFAEGTRSTDGRLRAFKKGAAILAIDAQVPLVPVAVAGAHEITPKGGLWVHSGRPLVLRVGKPIPTAGLRREDRDTLTRQAHDAVAALLEDGNRRVQEMLAT
jgi:1-acyl-sn-glycerol-3-phosphate acyltransferase